MGEWFRIPVPKPHAKRRLFVFHHAGGTGISFSRWINSMPDEVELVLAEMPGRGSRKKENPVAHFQQLGEESAKALRALLDRPSILYGHSMGSVWVLQTVRALNAAERARLLGVGLSAFLPPTVKNRQATPSLEGLSDDEFLQAMDRYGGIPAEIKASPELRAFFLPPLRRDFALFSTFQDDHQKIDLPALVFTGIEDLAAPAADLREWGNYFNLRGEVRTLPGGHFFVFAQGPAILQALLSEFVA